ncbi:MAG: hypothetical protein ACI9PN_002946 [Candidatus Azotimanducaceae bacterium]|mgnify:CR=1 FL=1|jgi:hypothetical protein
MEPDPVKPLTNDQTQLESWRTVMALSAEMNLQVELQNWTQLLELADQRDAMVAEFLAQSIPNAMYTRVMMDIEKLKQQHTLINSELARQQQHSQEKQRQLRQVREALVTSKVATDNGVEIKNVSDQKHRH